MGLVGLGFMGIKDIAIPTVKTDLFYSQFHSTNQIQYEWESNYGPRLSSLTAAFIAKKCGDALGKSP
jgi:hypothetical protein